MIQDIFPHILDNQYKPGLLAEPADLVLTFEGRKVLLKCGDKKEFPRVADFAADCTFTYLFSVDEKRFFLPAFKKLPEGFEFTDITFMRENYLMAKELMFAVLTGKHLSDWYANTAFCGKCGGKTTHSEKERAMCCPACGNTIYPRIMPAVIVGVKNGDKLLLTRYRSGYKHNALVAGFTEIGETLEQTVAREVMEEAGLKVKNITYYKSQPWGVASDILTGFYCEVDGDDTIRMDEGELGYAAWVERTDIELQPDDASLTNEMMKMFKEGLIS